MILLTCTLMSLIHVKQIKNHTKFLRQCVLMIENISILLEYNSLPIQEIFKCLLKNESLYLLEFIEEICKKIDISSDFEFVYSSSLNSLKEKYIDGEDKEYLLGFFSLLGKSDVNGQLSNCKLYKTFFKNKLNIVEKTEGEKCKTSIALNLGAGLCLSILIL